MDNGYIPFPARERAANDKVVHARAEAIKSTGRHTDSSAGPTGNENLHPAQFSAKHRKPSVGSTKAPNNMYQGKRRGTPANEAGSPAGKHRADQKHAASYSAGKDIGSVIGSTKRPEYSGKHKAPAEGKHGKSYSVEADIGSATGGAKKPEYAGKHRPKPPGEGKHGKAYNVDRDIAQSVGKNKKDPYKGKHEKGYKPPREPGKPFSLRFRPSKHEGKNKEHLRNLVK